MPESQAVGNGIRNSLGGDLLTAGGLAAVWSEAAPGGRIAHVGSGVRGPARLAGLTEGGIATGFDADWSHSHEERFVGDPSWLLQSAPGNQYAGGR